MVELLFTALCRFDGHRQIAYHRVLSGELSKGARPQGAVGGIIALVETLWLIHAIWRPCRARASRYLARGLVRIER